jgi:hypothetical protein
MKIKNNIVLYTALLIAIIFVTGCSGNAIQPVETSKADDSSFADILPNTEYTLESTITGKAPLQDGYYEEPVAQDSAAMTKVELSEQAFGDIDQDGFEDAAVTLLVESGGSGTFTYLALVLNEEGIAKPLPAVFLGDRIKVNSITIQSDSITVNLLTRDAGEPMSAEPTIEEIQTFTLVDDQLTQVK